MPLVTPWSRFVQRQADSAAWQRWTCLGLLAPTALVAATTDAGFLANLLLIIVSALAADAIAAWLRGISPGAVLADYSALSFALMFALTLTAEAPWWLGMSGAVFGLFIAKQAFGGHGEYLFQPLAAAYVFTRLGFPEFSGPSLMDTATAALCADIPATALIALALLTGALPLLILKAVDWRIPGVVFLTLILSLALSRSIDPPLWAFNTIIFTAQPSLLLVILFVATDPVTSPVTARGRSLFALLIALPMAVGAWTVDLTTAMAIVLLANFLTPLIDLMCRPRIFGHQNRGSVFLD